MQSSDGEAMQVDTEEEVSGTAVKTTPMDVTTDDDDAVAAQEEEARQAIEMLRGDEVSGRVTAASRLETIALALGQERTRDELLPFLTDGVDDEDEVLVVVAESLGRLVDHVGGPDHAHTLLEPLELLLMVEEGTVRQAASSSAQAVSNVLSDDAFQALYAAMLVRLATKQWFTARLSAAALLSSAYPRLNAPLQEDFLQRYLELCRDDTPMVRRVASQYLGHFVQVVVQAHGRGVFETPGGIVAKLLFPLYEELTANTQPDSVRLQTTASCVAFGEAVTKAAANQGGDAGPAYSESELDLVQQLLPLIVATIDDRSWRVRWTAASKFALVVQAYHDIPNTLDALIPAYEKLLQDPEAEVRTAATFNLASVATCPGFVSLTSTTEEGEGGETGVEEDGKPKEDGPRVTVAERLVKRVTGLTEDDSEHVRAALAMVTTELAPILGREATITHLVPPVLLLLRDAVSEVRLNLISSLSALNEVIGIDLLSQSLLPAILDLAQDGKWRIRLAIIEHIPMLAEQLGKEFFSQKLASLCVAWLGDDISSIRQASATNLKALVSVFGTKWAVEYIVPSIKDIRLHQSYLRRLIAVQACSMMSEEMEAETVILELLPMMLEMSVDMVPNIRFNVAKALEAMGPVCGKVVYESQIRPVLAVLIEDSDRDVRFFSVHATRVLDRQLLHSTS